MSRKQYDEWKDCNYVLRDAEAGNIIDGFGSYEEAADELKRYEKQDMSDGCYEEGFYEIARRDDDAGDFLSVDAGGGI